MPHPLRLTQSALSAAILLALAGGGQAAAQGATAAIPLAQGHLPSYTASYAISGAAKGTMTWTVTHGAATTVVEIHQVVSGQVEDDRVVLTSRGLRFVTVQEKVQAPGLKLTIAAHAKGGKIDETAKVNGRPETITYPYGKATLVNVALLPVLAGLGLQPGEKQVVQDVILKHGRTVPIGLATTAQAKLTTPAGTFQAVPVTLSGAGPTQQAFIATKGNLLVKYQNGQTTITLQKVTR